MRQGFRVPFDDEGVELFRLSAGSRRSLLGKSNYSCNAQKCRKPSVETRTQPRRAENAEWRAAARSRWGGVQGVVAASHVVLRTPSRAGECPQVTGVERDEPSRVDRDREAAWP